MTRRPLSISWAFAILALCQALSVRADEQKLTCPLGREYFLYMPDKIDPDRTYWLVAGIHGFKGNGQGAGGYAEWIKKGNCLVVGPSMPNGYQGLGLETDAQLIGIAKALGEKYRLQSKMFIVGFSGGAQFAHRFTLKHPDLVVGCAAQSAGSWANAVSTEIRGVPFAISCGQKDTEKSTPDGPMNRIEWARNFADLLANDDAFCKVRFWPNVGHAQSPGSQQLAEDCFALATTGLHENQLPPVRQEYEAIVRLMANRQFADVQSRIAKLPKMKLSLDAERPKPADGAQPPGLTEDKFGWHLGAKGAQTAETARQSFLDELAAELTRKLERAVLEQIVILTDNPSPAGLRQLMLWQRDFVGNKTIQAALDQAQAKFKNGSPK